MTPAIITCAITGSIHTPSMSPYLPIDAEAIARQSVDAAAAGAAILHLHARDPLNGRPSAKTSDFMAFLPAIAARTDAVINISTGGSAVMPLEERVEGATAAQPEMCSLNMGTMNFALYPMAAQKRDWKHNWELPFLQYSDDLVFKNTPRDIAYILETFGTKGKTRFEYECYDLGHLYMLAHFAERGLAKPPFFVQFVFGVLGGIGAHPDHLDHFIATTDRLLGDQYLFSVLAAGRHQFAMGELAIERGGHVRVGLEDNLYIKRGVLARSNAELVEKMRGKVEATGRRIATPAEAREMLMLKGLDATEFAA